MVHTAQVTPGHVPDNAPPVTTFVLLTRPMEVSERFARLLQDRFGEALSIVISPVIEIAYPDVAWPTERPAGVVFTSTHGVEAVRRANLDPELFAALPAYCVGDQTAQAAGELGLNAVSARGTARDLIEMLDAKAPRGRLIYLRGDHIATDLAREAEARGILLEERVVYRQVDMALNDAAKAVLNAQTPVILPVFSPRSAERLAQELTEAEKERHVVICISRKVADVAAEAGVTRYVVAERPDADAVKDQIAAFVETGDA